MLLISNTIRSPSPFLSQVVNETSTQQQNFTAPIDLVSDEQWALGA
ncbi:hypothetical protein D046_4724 [Vibrio parahaemolyticus V-223/04]|nr:hypothetical protein D052_3807 [Vibrio parahaemolyticus 10290]EQM10198.1 hypothetical protein D045_2950 [Vibrio parahaemolyticus VP-NY4]EQM40312.1 hypothetical protein D042_0803 [Vibrio parahaemolyticus NIHCB0757]EVU14975.1 hypothetical protein D046_4724 [Vibrio parahaemolyticus V-223/04]